MRLTSSAPQFSFNDVEVITATLDVEDVRSYRGAIASRGAQASKSVAVPRVNVEFDLTSTERRPPTSPIDARMKASRCVLTPPQVKYLLSEQEIAFGPSTWLWDYLRRSKTGGFFLPLSGGADSSSVAAMVHIMCCRLVSEIKAGNKAVLRDLQTLTGETNFVPTDSKEIAGKIFYTSCALSVAKVVANAHAHRHGLAQLI
jgi:NAD+ synthase (glutamine-hydrolysing)